MNRRGVYRGIFCVLLDDPDYQRLSPDARLVLLTLRLSAQAGAAAIFRPYLAVIAEQTGLDVDTVEKALDELAASPSPERPWIYREAGVVWVRNALRYDPNLRLADPKHKKSVQRAVEALPRLAIVERFCAYYEIACPFDDSPKGPARPSEDISSPKPETRNPRPDTRNPKPEDEYRPSSDGLHTPPAQFIEVDLDQ